MAKITLHCDSSYSATSVSNIFIDEYMSGANGEFVKIYLYLLRLMNAPDTAFSISSIADKFEHTEKDIRRALGYWERMHLLRLEYDSLQNLTGIRLLHSIPSIQDQIVDTAKQADGACASDEAQAVFDSTDLPTVSAEEDLAAPSLAEESYYESVMTVPEKRDYTADDVKSFRQNESIAELFFISERYLGRTLSATDINTILYLCDGLNFSPELVEYLIEHCVSRGHTSIRYIEKTALGWTGSGISSVEEAKQASGIHGQACFTVMKSLGISGRNLVPSEIAFIEKWKSEYSFPLDLISEACQRTIQSIHQPSFEYTDKILLNWKKNRISTLDDVKKLDTAFQSQKKNTSVQPSSNASKNKFNNFKQRSYDYDQLEKMLLNTAPPQ